MQIKLLKFFNFKSLVIKYLVIIYFDGIRTKIIRKNRARQKRYILNILNILKAFEYIKYMSRKEA